MEDVATYATTLTSYAASAVGLRELHAAARRSRAGPGHLVSGSRDAGARTRRAGRGAPAVPRGRARRLGRRDRDLAGTETAPYRFLHEHLVFVRGVRALSRFSLVPILALSVLAGFALAGRRRLVWPPWSCSHARVGRTRPLPLSRTTARPRPSRWLAGRPGAVARLPLGDDDTARMLDSVAHWRPLVNGDSGFVPRPFTARWSCSRTAGRDGGPALPARGRRDARRRAARRDTASPSRRRVARGNARGRALRGRARRRGRGRGRGAGRRAGRAGGDALHRTTGSSSRCRGGRARSAASRSSSPTPSGSRGRASRRRSTASPGSPSRSPARASPTRRSRSTATRRTAAARSASLRARCVSAPRPAAAGSRGAGRGRPVGARAARPRPANRAITWRSRRERHPASRHTAREPAA